MNKVSKGLFWKILERFSVYGVQFVLQIILARLLSPENYGVLSIMVIFTTLANVFIQNGFNTSLIQNKDVDESDYSSVFWLTLGVAGMIYIVLFLAAPLIAAFYDMPDFVLPFRVLVLMLFPGTLNSIQLAKVSREMNFKLVFRSNLTATIVSGVIGVILAYMGAGLWALVAQTLLNAVVVCIVMWFTVKWRPRLVCDLSRIKVLFSFGWKLLVSGLLDTLYQDLRSLVIGKRYDSAMLGYYNRGKQFPQILIHAINGAVQSVMLPAMAEKQDEKIKVKFLMRNSIKMSAYILFPMMAGLAGVATPLVKWLLTDKWLPCVPFLQIYCFTLAFYPVHSCNLQAINAMGRSDIFLKLEIIKKSYGLLSLLIAVFCFDSPIAIAMTGAITTVFSSFINAYPNKNLIGYSYVDQIKDILPSIVAALIMCAGVLIVGQLSLPNGLLLILQIIVGIIIYLAVSIVAKIDSFLNLIKLIRSFKTKVTE